MSSNAYDVVTISTNRYEFISRGPKGAIPKVAEITPTGIAGFHQFVFGNRKEDGGVDDRAETNNGDLPKIFATLLNIIDRYSSVNPDIELVFEGSTEQRTRVYHALLHRYKILMEKSYFIHAFVEKDGMLLHVDFDPASGQVYCGFSLIRNHR